MRPNRKAFLMKAKREGKAGEPDETRSRSKSPKLAPTATSRYRSRSPLSPLHIRPTDGNLEFDAPNQTVSQEGSHKRHLTPNTSQVEQALEETQSDKESEASVIFVSSRPVQKKTINDETSKKKKKGTSENSSPVKHGGSQDDQEDNSAASLETANAGGDISGQPINSIDAQALSTARSGTSRTSTEINPREDAASEDDVYQQYLKAKSLRQAICYKKVPLTVKEWDVKQMLVDKGISNFIDVRMAIPERSNMLYGPIHIDFANVADAESAKKKLSKKHGMWNPEGKKFYQPQMDKEPVPHDKNSRFNDAKMKTRLLKVVTPYQSNMAMVEERLLKEGGVAQGPWKSDYPEFRCVFKFDDADAARLARILLTPWPAPKVVGMFGDDFRGIELQYKGTPLEVDSDAEGDAPAGLQPMRLERRPTKSKATTDRGPKRPVYPWKREDEVHDHWADRG